MIEKLPRELWSNTNRILKAQSKVNHFYGGTSALCSRNFQNVKLRLEFVEIFDFTYTPILREIKFWQTQTVQKKIFFGNFKGNDFW